MDVHIDLYRIAHFQNDTEGMKRELDWAAGNPDEFRMPQEQAVLAMQEGRLETTGELLRRANDLAARQHLDLIGAKAGAMDAATANIGLQL